MVNEGFCQMFKVTLIVSKILLLLALSHASLFASHRSRIIDDSELITAFKINNVQEFNSLIKKIKVETAVKIKNNSNKAAHIDAKLFTSANAEMTLRYRLSPKSSVEWEPPKGWFLSEVTAPTGQHISFKWQKNSHATLILAEKEALAFPRPLGDFNFVPRFLMRQKKKDTPSEEIYHDTSRPVPPNLTQRFQKEYDDNLHYLLYAACPGERVDPLEFFTQRSTLYAKNRLETSLFSLSDIPDQIDFKIPQRIHKVWLTDPKKPTELPEHYIEWAKRSVTSNSPSEGWKHYLWIQNEAILPETILRLKDTGIKVRTFKNLTVTFEEAEIFLTAIGNNKFGTASDFLRALIIREKGGIYLDTDYVLRQSAAVICKLYNFFAGLEPMSSFVCNAIFGASKQHPIIQKYVEIMVRNHNQTSAPRYIKDVPSNDPFKTILVTGPSALGFAIYHASNQGNNRDIIFPPKMLYPTPIQSYPQKEVVKDGSPLPVESLGEHFWETAWNNKTFGSVG